MVVTSTRRRLRHLDARAIARFIGKHIPGAPTVVVRNMPGAGGIYRHELIYIQTAERDGTVLGLVQNNTPLEPLFGTKQARYDAAKFNWLGTPSVEVAHGAAVAHGAGEFGRRAGAPQKPNGRVRRDSTPAFYTRLLNATLGTKMKLIPGYPGQNDAFLAMERGELDGYPSVFYSALYLDAAELACRKEGKGHRAVRPGEDEGIGRRAVRARSHHQRRRQAAAAGRLDAARAWTAVVDAARVPADRLGAMRKALAETFADPDFLADAKKIGSRSMRRVAATTC